MKVTEVEVYANHPWVLIGADDFAEASALQAPAGSNGKHVGVQTRGQVALMRVTLWSRAMPLSGTIVFDGLLDLPDHRICVFDIENLNRLAKRTNATGVQRVVVAVDDPGQASRVNVGLDLGDSARSMPLTSVAGHPLPAVMVAAGEKFVRVTELGLVLAQLDSPLARLAGAAKLLSRPRLGGDPYPSRFETNMLIQWLRRLATSTTVDQATTLADRVIDRLRSGRPSAATQVSVDELALSIASMVIDTAAQQS